MNTPKTRPCNYCGKEYQPQTARSRFCSGACRAKASRRAHGAITDDPSAASQRRNATKAEQAFERVCKQCGVTFTANGKQGRQVFCSAKCRKRAHIESKRLTQE